MSEILDQNDIDSLFGTSAAITPSPPPPPPPSKGPKEGSIALDQGDIDSLFSQAKAPEPVRVDPQPSAPGPVIVPVAKPELTRVEAQPSVAPGPAPVPAAKPEPASATVPATVPEVIKEPPVKPGPAPEPPVKEGDAPEELAALTCHQTQVKNYLRVIAAAEAIRLLTNLQNGPELLKVIEMILDMDKSGQQAIKEFIINLQFEA
ncbi:MAG: hypothetical protein HQK60_10475 [Deltaproteobacteria bacterium]|nr:hypothetical protein [Deltaproteobacteria bacterium]